MKTIRRPNFLVVIGALTFAFAGFVGGLAFVDTRIGKLVFTHDMVNGGPMKYLR